MSLNREKVLETLKDLVKTLRSPNFQEPKIQEIWRERKLEFQETIAMMEVSDLRWMEVKYGELHLENIYPHMTEEMKKDTKLF